MCDGREKAKNCLSESATHACWTSSTKSCASVGGGRSGTARPIISTAGVRARGHMGTSSGMRVVSAEPSIRSASCSGELGERVSALAGVEGAENDLGGVSGGESGAGLGSSDLSSSRMSIGLEGVRWQSIALLAPLAEPLPLPLPNNVASLLRPFEGRRLPDAMRSEATTGVSSSSKSEATTASEPSQSSMSPVEAEFLRLILCACE